MLVGPLGKPSRGDPDTNIHSHDILFTAGDKAALRVLYDEEIDPSKKLNMAAIESAISQILSR